MKLTMNHLNNAIASHNSLSDAEVATVWLSPLDAEGVLGFVPDEQPIMLGHPTNGIQIGVTGQCERDHIYTTHLDYAAGLLKTRSVKHAYCPEGEYHAKPGASGPAQPEVRSERPAPYDAGPSIPKAKYRGDSFGCLRDMAALRKQVCEATEALAQEMQRGTGRYRGVQVILTDRVQFGSTLFTEE